MGDSFQNLVAPDIAAQRAVAEGDRMLSWLIAEEIVAPETKDCILGADLGHPPGPQYSKVTARADPHLLGLRSNGLAVITKRTVFHSGQGSFTLLCSACRSKFGPLDGWGEAVSEWFKQSGPGNLTCPVCGISQSIAEWQYDPPWAFGDLGFKFWNWPRFTQGFVREFEIKLGSRIVRVYGNL